MPVSLSKKFHFLLFLVLFFLFGSALSAFGGEISLSAAASLREALVEISDEYSRSHPEVSFIRNFAGSGTLAKQIAVGAPADIYVSAASVWMDYLVEEGRIRKESVGTLACNSLVLVGGEGTEVSSLSEVGNLRRIAIGSPGSVPAGRYAELALSGAGLYRRLLAEKKLVMAKDVRQALIYAERGEVDGAFVYGTDALLARNVAVLLVVPRNLYPRVSYPVGVTVSGAQNSDALDFLDYLQSEEAGKILQKRGFLLQ